MSVGIRRKVVETDPCSTMGGMGGPGLRSRAARPCSARPERDFGFRFTREVSKSCVAGVPSRSRWGTFTQSGTFNRPRPRWGTFTQAKALLEYLHAAEGLAGVPSRRPRPRWGIFTQPKAFGVCCWHAPRCLRKGTALGLALVEEGSTEHHNTLPSTPETSVFLKQRKKKGGVQGEKVTEG